MATQQLGESRNLIDGRLVASSSGATFENVNPATEETIGVTADATREDMESAIAAARRAFDAGRWADDAAFRARLGGLFCVGREREAESDTAR